jgi:hypothetical protein
MDQLLANPAYIVFLSDPAQNLSSLDVDQALAGNMFVQGFNFTLPKPVQPGARDIAAHPNQTLADAGPRIWLDDAGFSVGMDQMITVTASVVCPMRTVNASLQVWNCALNNTDAFTVLNAQAAQPQIWWDASPYAEDHYLRPDRSDNPWMSLGAGGNTAAMKQVFTVTKENRRHTFLQTVIKVTMLTMYPTPFDNTEITDIVRRMISEDSRLTPKIEAIANIVIGAQTNQTSLTLGFSNQEDYSVSSSRIELLNVVNPFLITERLYTSLRIISTNITLIRSETLPNPVMPYGSPCPNFFTNLATGGKVHSTDCYKSTGNETGAHFLGQLDASTVLLLNDVLGDGTKSVSAAALNQTGVDWFTQNAPHIDELLIARGLILGGDRAAVPLALQTRQPAISYLQLLLFCFSAILMIAAMVLSRLCESSGYYNSSFLAAVCATMHIDGRNDKPKTCAQAGYLREPPEIKLVTTHQHVVISTSGRVFTTVVGRNEKDINDDESR